MTKLSYASPYLTMHVPRDTRQTLGERLQDWKARPSVKGQVLDVPESRAPLHVSVLYDIHMPQGLEDARRLRMPAPMQLQLAGPLNYFDSRDKTKTAITLTVQQPPGEQLNQLHQLMRKRIPNGHAFPDYLPHTTVAYIRHGTRLAAADEAALLGAVTGTAWLQKKVFFVDAEGTTLHKIRAAE